MSVTAEAPVTPEAAPKATTLKSVKIIGILTIIAGVILSLGGGITWFTVQDHLKAENIVVAEDASSFAGKPVAGPFTAYAEADIINKHAMKATDGKTYAELDREDPKRSTAMNASFLRASLFTSVVSFGVAAMAMGMGVVFVLIGAALTKVGGARIE